MDSQKLDTFMQKIVGDLGAAFSIAPVRIGGALGIYGAMAELGATSSARLATSMGLAERYVREWLWHQAASGYVEYDANTGQFTLPPEHAFVLADPHGGDRERGAEVTNNLLEERIEFLTIHLPVLCLKLRGR